MSPEKELQQWLIAMILIIVGVVAYDWITVWLGV